jgi:antitoxin (DNA-binding transcriptional repressor) of toxin-antitoxin stability system
MYIDRMIEPPRMGIRDFRADLPKRVEAAHFQSEPTIITKNDEPRAALVPYTWYAAQLEGKRPAPG